MVASRDGVVLTKPIRVIDREPALERGVVGERQPVEQRDLDEDQRLVRHRRVEEGEATPVGRAHAALHGRDHVLPDDIQTIAPVVLAHRLLLSSEAQLARRDPVDIVSEIVRHTRVPAAR